MKSIGLRCTDEFHKKVSDYAYAKRVSVARVVRVALEKEIEARKNI
jgi:hypothetical protein